MPGPLPEINDKDFQNQMEQLAAKAVSGAGASATKNGEPAARQRGDDDARKEQVAEQVAAGLEKRIGPLVAALEALGRATAQHSRLIEGMEKATRNFEPLANEISGIRAAHDERNAIDQRMFDALHHELKSYKDEFLLDVLQKPVVSGMVTLHDDLCEVCRQVQELLGRQAAEENAAATALQYIATNMDHAIHTLIEVMSRIGVELIEVRGRKLDWKHQKAVSVEPAASIDEDSEVVKKLRRGFMWRNRVFRAEEVVIKKFKEGCLLPLPCFSETGEEQAGAAGENR